MNIKLKGMRKYPFFRRFILAKEKSVIRSTIGLNCPNCRQGKLFKKKGWIVYSDMLDMYEDCPNCNFHYEIEPGFWLGSLWTSYPIIILIEVPFLFLALFADGAMT